MPARRSVGRCGCGRRGYCSPVRLGKVADGGAGRAEVGEDSGAGRARGEGLGQLGGVRDDGNADHPAGGCAAAGGLGNWPAAGAAGQGRCRAVARPASSRAPLPRPGSTSYRR